MCLDKINLDMNIFEPSCISLHENPNDYLNRMKIVEVVREYRAPRATERILYVCVYACLCICMRVHREKTRKAKRDEMYTGVRS